MYESMLRLPLHPEAPKILDPFKAGWLEQFEREALEMPTKNMAIRGSKYLGHKWDAFKHLMPAHVVEHINGNAIYNLKPRCTLACCYDA